MSVKLMTVVWDSFTRGGAEKLVLLALADWAGDDGGRIYPSIAAIARKTNISERQAQRIMHRLVDDGILTPCGFEKGGRGHAVNYRMNIDALKGDNATPLKDERVTPETPKGDIFDVKGDTAMSPEPLEPPRNPLLSRQPKIHEKRKCRIPPDWEIVEDDPNHLYAKSKGLSWDDMCTEEEKFKLYHEANGSVMLDWNKAFKKWVLQSLQFKRPKHGAT